MQTRTYLVLGFIIACGVSACDSGGTYSQMVVDECAKWRMKECKKNCTSGEFRTCYYDKRKGKSEIDPRQECFGMVVGTTCAPCSEIFALNFAGAVKEVSCEEFLKAVESRNKECNDCIQKYNMGD